jgi:hypothetical protein
LSAMYNRMGWKEEGEKRNKQRENVVKLTIWAKTDNLERVSTFQGSCQNFETSEFHCQVIVGFFLFPALFRAGSNKSI